MGNRGQSLLHVWGFFRVRAKKISSASLEDREPFGLSVKPEVLEVEQPSRMRRQVGLYADRRDVSPYSRPRFVNDEVCELLEAA